MKHALLVLSRALHAADLARRRLVGARRLVLVDEAPEVPMRAADHDLGLHFCAALSQLTPR